MDSPVNIDSSMVRLLELSKIASAGMQSPSLIIKRSPQTTSRPAIRFSTPSRITKARGLERLRKVSKARSVLCS